MGRKKMKAAASQTGLKPIQHLVDSKIEKKLSQSSKARSVRRSLQFSPVPCSLLACAAALFARFPFPVEPINHVVTTQLMAKSLTRKDRKMNCYVGLPEAAHRTSIITQNITYLYRISCYFCMNKSLSR